MHLNSLLLTENYRPMDYRRVFVLLRVIYSINVSLISIIQ